MIYVILSSKIHESYIDSNLMNRKKENIKNGINTSRKSKCTFSTLLLIVLSVSVNCQIGGRKAFFMKTYFFFSFFFSFPVYFLKVYQDQLLDLIMIKCIAFLSS